MQNRHMSGEKTAAGTREEVLNGNGGMHHLTIVLGRSGDL